MYSSEGLADWEMVVVSGSLALGMLVISAVIGAVVACLALREHATVPGRVAEAKTSRATPVPAMERSEPLGIGRGIAVG